MIYISPIYIPTQIHPQQHEKPPVIQGCIYQVRLRGTHSDYKCMTEDEYLQYKNPKVEPPTTSSTEGIVAGTFLVIILGTIIIRYFKNKYGKSNNTRY